MLKSYEEVNKLESYEERLRYLRTHENPGNKNRKLMNMFYKGDPWLYVKGEVEKRDMACDLGIPGLVIEGPILVHHINPIYEEDVMNESPLLLDQNNLICCSLETHNKIHYSKEEEPYVERRPGDTKLW